ncbi:PREDICTED: GLABROUS1 enhancer-binding protein-like 3 [Camelina sativa]|uniref:GLABROUS1 enhancer-binding protein-like 3 n=1 Tax=Camelina sativa TaxID=90675 RepID=A0ABM0Z2G6_CAMSA|nr:PREDICTED: GLABROUS1 enhancer-binding protein-like 3 [Camelina sativa]
MVATKRVGDHSNSSSDDSITRKRDDDHRTRKQLKTTTTKTTLKSSSASKMNWSKNDELVILGGIVDYEIETKSSHGSDWAALYLYVKDNVEAKFSKKQFIDKVKRLKRRFIYNQERTNDGKDVSFTDTDDDEIFKLSMMIWAKSETEHVVSNEDMDQAKDVPSGEQEGKSVPCAEQERVSVEIDNGEKEKLDQAKDVPCAEQEDKDVPGAELEDKDVPCAEKEDKDVPCAEKEDEDVPGAEQEDKDVPCAEKEDEDVPGAEQEDKDVPCAEQEQVSNEIDNGEQEMIEEDGVDELGVMEDTLESVISFQSLAKNGEKDKSEEDGVGELGVLLEILEADKFYQNCSKYQQKLLRQKLENVGAERRKELIDEWKALLVQEMKLSIKKFNFLAKIANAGVGVSP